MSISALDLIQNDYQSVLQNDAESFASLKNNVIVITGGTGFIGTWVSGFIAFLNDHFSFNTHTILIARNIESFKKSRAHLANRKDITLINSDIRHLVELPSETNWLIHAAGTPDNRFHSSNPLETMSIIANGTYSILRLLERCSNFKMLLHLSSGLIYGSQPLKQATIDENYVGAPRCGTVSAAYAEAKRFAETLCHSSRSQARIPVVTARPFAFIGPYQSLETPWAINNFIKDALSGNSIRILGDGQTVRSYMYASDLSFWLTTILTQGKSGEVYNVGSPHPITLEKLAHLIANEVNPELEVQLKTANNPLQNSRFIPDVSFAENNLRLSVKTNLETAIKRTIAWNKK